MLPSAAGNTRVSALRVALIGNPNTGKSTLFNALAGMRVRTGNFPGVTVERKLGSASWQQQSIELIDLPGTYSLSPRSPDEMVTVDVLTGCGGEIPPDVVVCICNAAALERNLFLATQVREIGLPTVLCLNMWDAAERAGLSIDIAALSRELGMPVVTTSALQQQGLESLKLAVLDEFRNQSDRPQPMCLLSAPVQKEVHHLTEWLTSAGCPAARRSRFLVLRSLLDADGTVEQMLVESSNEKYSEELLAARERLAAQSLSVPGVEATERYQAIGQLLKKIAADHSRPGNLMTDRLDAILTHRFFGFIICLAVMLLVFSTINWFSQPLNSVVESAVAGLADLVTGSMAPGPFRSLLVDGVISGVGAVVIFLPQICLLFLFIALLEDCGYMARAAFMMDRVMAVAGLSGRSFLPLMSSFACAVPAIMATRVIEDRKDRFVTIMIAPLMSCSARLPVYLLMTGLFVPDISLGAGVLPSPLTLPLRAVVLLGMSMLGMFIALPVAFLLRRTVFRGEPAAFLLELPDYRLPSLRVTLNRVRESASAFLKQAGTLIFATSVLVWFAGSWPGSQAERYRLTAELEELRSAAGEADSVEHQKAEQLTEALNHETARLLENSLLGYAGHVIEPLVKPLGWDWRIGIGVVASFPAREVIVATLGTIFSLGADVDENSEGLRGALLAARNPDGSAVFNLPVAASVMVFFALCAQCVSTLVVIRSETGSWRWPIFSFVYMTTLAWVCACLTYQIGVRL